MLVRNYHWRVEMQLFPVVESNLGGKMQPEHKDGPDNFLALPNIRRIRY
mgnify:CR=1 FL=1